MWDSLVDGSRIKQVKVLQGGMYDRAIVYLDGEDLVVKTHEIDGSSNETRVPMPVR
jgi:hypothetical protein